MINKFRFWDAKHLRWFRGHPNDYERSIQTDAIDLFGETFLFGEAYHDQHEDDVWKNDKDIKGTLDMIDCLSVINPSQAFDKNGFLIYEGDILKYGPNFFVVYFDKNSLSWKVINNNTYDTFQLSNYCLDSLIIGNAYDNPKYFECIPMSVLIKKNVEIPKRIFIKQRF